MPITTIDPKTALVAIDLQAGLQDVGWSELLPELGRQDGHRSGIPWRHDTG